MLLSEIEQKGFVKFIKDALNQASIRDRFSPEHIEHLVSSVKNVIRSGIKELAVRKTIEDMGYKSHHGGMWAWDGNSWEATAATSRLANELGVSFGAHSGTHEARAIESYYDDISGLKEGRYSHKKYRENVTQTNQQYLDKISPELRRVLYIRGFI